MTNRPTQHVSFAPALLTALLGLLWLHNSNAALPSAMVDAPAAKSDSAPAPARVLTPAAAATPKEAESPAAEWNFPPVRVGGILSYDLRRDVVDDKIKTQKGLTTTLSASSSTFIWQPWFARVNGALSLSLTSDKTSAIGAASDVNATGEQSAAGTSAKSALLTGNLQLSVLPRSEFPFEAHIDRSDSRVTADLSQATVNANQRIGFSQHYMRPEGDAMIGWDRNSQLSAGTSGDKQDALQLNISHSMEHHRLVLNGTGTWNSHESTGETAVQKSVSLQHSYAPDSTISVESLANISSSAYNLQQGNNNTRLVQLSSLAFWRPRLHDAAKEKEPGEDQDQDQEDDAEPEVLQESEQSLTITGGARMFMLGVDTTGVAANTNATGTNVRNSNFNVGANYDVSRYTRINGSANLTLAGNGGDSTDTPKGMTNQSIGASYQPEAIDFGSLRYQWSTSASATNRTGSAEAGRQGALLLSHSLSRPFKLSGGSIFRLDAGQSLAAVANGATSVTPANASEQLTHSGSASWDMSAEGATAVVQLSANDSRTIGGTQEFFQLVNFQLSSNLPVGHDSSLNGNLTIQTSRQSSAIVFANVDALNPQANIAPQKSDWTGNSTGSVTYQNSRAFGIRRLRFVSDLRLNSQALLPLLGNAQDQEIAAWENRFDFSIGRTQLRLSALISRSTTPKILVGSAVATESIKKINKSIMFTVARSIGDF